MAGSLNPGTPELSEMIPGTRFFTTWSEAVGARLGVWVTVPPAYALGTDPLPVLYVTGANMQVALTAPLGVAMSLDPIRPVRPHIQVAIGYVGDDARDFIRVRNRDLVPPGEPFPHQMADHLRPRVDRGLLPEETFRRIVDELSSTCADRFLSFIEDELHPEIAAAWRIDSDDAGLFGYSYGALFSLYAFARPSRLFRTVGASSPGVLSPESEVYRLYRERLASGDAGPSRLHLTVNASEGSGPEALYRDLSARYLQTLDLIRREPLPGVRVTAETLIGEVHATGIIDGFRSFLRACYGADPAGAVVIADGA